MIFKKKESTQELLGIEAITDYGISTKQGELVFFAVAPTNLSVLPADSIDARINALLNIIKGYEVVEKKTVETPDELRGIVKCNNPVCICNNEPMLTIFNVIDKAHGIIKCHYCDKEQELSKVKLC